jgi:hypothetical protein
MKKLLAILMIAASVAFFTSCSNTSETESTTSDSLSVDGNTVMTAPAASSYIDPVTGATVTRDEATGFYINASGEPVEFYVDATTMDTFYGKTGVNVNNAIIHDGDDWRLDEAKIKVDDDEIKIKNADGSKTKIEDDEIKIKDANGKAKMDGDETKIKTGDTKIKSSAEGTKVKED